MQPQGFVERHQRDTPRHARNSSTGEAISFAQAVDNTGVIPENPPITAASVIHNQWNHRWKTTPM